ncbi:hypothetical protein LCGC14_0715870 [marine sediment metagenome]|uniref:Uncharacterized protein n=1 Tax=marine sediment metagenome TaxID=412755 RepID=A0A0F9TL65_9ZZZZ
MPLSVETISKGDSLDSVRRKISRTIDQLIHNENKTPKEAAGQAYGMAEKAWGRKIPRGN